MTTDNYQVGGSLSINNSTYVKRQADEELFESLKAGEFCYVLSPRQMGKSSLKVRTMYRLQEIGVVCAAIDISAIGSQNVSLDEWYGGLVDALNRSLQLSIDLGKWWGDRHYISPVLRWSEFISEILLARVSQNIVIFIDEIDSILGLDFTDDFLASLRACYNQRATNPNYQRQAFALFGVATPDALIRDKNRTPFNIGRAIALSGFELAEALPLTTGWETQVDRPEAVLKEILNWTGGQPFLTQKICQLIQQLSSPIAEGREAKFVEKLVRSRVVENWAARDEPPHLRLIRDRLLSQGHRTIFMLELYQQIGKRGEVAAAESLEATELQCLGLVVKQEESLSIANPIYKSVFDRNFIKSALLETKESLRDSRSSFVTSEPPKTRWIVAIIMLILGLGGYWLWQGNRYQHFNLNSILPIVVSDSCPEAPPSGLQLGLDTVSVEELTIGDRIINKSGNITAGKYIVYAFDGRAGQQLNYRTDDNICIWVYTPENQLLNGIDLSQNGSYLLLISTTKNSTNFELELSLESGVYDANLANDSTVRLPPPPTQNTSEFSQDGAVDLVNQWLQAKSEIFASPYDKQLAEKYLTGPLYADITKPNGAIDWLQTNNYYYVYSNARIQQVWAFSSSGVRPQLKVSIYEERKLYTPQGVDYTQSGTSPANYTYYFERDNGIWKIYDYQEES